MYELMLRYTIRYHCILHKNIFQILLARFFLFDIHAQLLSGTTQKVYFIYYHFLNQILHITYLLYPNREITVFSSKPTERILSIFIFYILNKKTQNQHVTFIINCNKLATLIKTQNEYITYILWF